MKKFLSIILATAMIMTIFCAVPASAEDAPAPVVNDWPYYLNNVENGEARLRVRDGGGATAEAVDGGAFGSKKAIKCTLGTNNAPFCLTKTDSSMIYGNDNIVYAGDTVKFSAYVKIPYAYQTGNFTFMMHFDSNQTATPGVATTLSGGGYYGSVEGQKGDCLTFDPTKVDVWQKIQVSYTAPVTRAINGDYFGLWFRFGSYDYVNTPVDTTIPNPVFYLDDIEFEISRASDSKPAVTATAAFGEAVAGSEIDLRYTETNLTAENNTSIVKLMAGDNTGKACVATYLLGDTITVPENAAGKKLSLEIVPISGTGKTRLIGDTVSINVVKKIDYDHKDIVTATTDVTTATAQIDLTINDSAADPIYGVIIILAYNDNILLGYDAKCFSCSYGDPVSGDEGKKSYNLPTGTNRVESYVWGTDTAKPADKPETWGIFNTNMKNLTEVKALPIS
ncbi:MAG: hypothetical protein IJC10_02770 [Clostridia bacterium]|nr:hypothetical protein [Clostridia bacterium]